MKAQVPNITPAGEGVHSALAVRLCFSQDLAQFRLPKDLIDLGDVLPAQLLPLNHSLHHPAYTALVDFA